MSSTLRYWYSFKGPGFDPLALDSYTRLPGDPNCVGKAQLCAIYVYSPFGSFNPPELSDNIVGYISSANAGSSNGYPTTGGKYFLYNKN